MQPLWKTFQKLSIKLQVELLSAVQRLVTDLCPQIFETLWTVACQAPLSLRILQERILEWVAMPPPQNYCVTQQFHSCYIYPLQKSHADSNTRGKNRDRFKKIRDTKGIFHAKMSTIKNRKKELDMTGQLN